MILGRRFHWNHISASSKLNIKDYYYMFQDHLLYLFIYNEHSLQNNHTWFCKVGIPLCTPPLPNNYLHQIYLQNSGSKCAKQHISLPFRSRHFLWIRWKLSYFLIPKIFKYFKIFSITVYLSIVFYCLWLIILFVVILKYLWFPVFVSHLETYWMFVGSR